MVIAERTCRSTGISRPMSEVGGRVTDRSDVEPLATSFRIDGCVVLPALNRIQRGNEVVQVEPRVMAVLLCLVRRPGEVLSREQIFEAVWPDVVVGEEALTRTISELRRHFGDDARSPRVIETIRKGGYRLVAPVSGSEGPETHTITTGAPRARRGPTLRALFAAAVVIAAVLVLRTIPSPRAPQNAWHVRPLTSYPGPEYMPAISPDGSMLAFSWRGENPPEDVLLDIYVMQIENGMPVRLTNDPGHDLYPVFSPDGTTIAYASGAEEAREIRTVPVLGGEPRTLLAVGSPVAGIDWSPDGATLAYAARSDSGAAFRIRLLDLTTMRSTLLDVPRHDGDDVTPAYAPDGETLAFVNDVSFNQQHVLYTRPGSGVVEELSGVEARVAGIDWMSDDALVVSTSDLSDYDLWLVDLDTSRRTWLTIPGRPAIMPAVARGGSRLVYGQLAYECNIWDVDVRADGTVRVNEAPLVASTYADYNAIASPDGRRIAFLSDRTGRAELWTANADGTSPRPLTRGAGTYLMGPRWSPDGGRLAFSAMADDRLGVFVTDVGTGGTRRVSGPDRHELLVYWSASGDWLYTRTEREDGWELWRRHSDGTCAVRVARNGYTLFGETRDGALIGKRDGEMGIWRIDPLRDEPVLVVPAATAGRWTGIAVAPEGLFVIRRGLSAASLGFFPWGAAREDSLATLPIDSGMLDLSADGSRLLYDCTTHFEIDLMLAESHR